MAVSHHQRQHLTHRVFEKSKRTGIAMLAKYRGPVRDFIDGLYPDAFLEHCNLVRCDEDYEVEMVYGSDVERSWQADMGFGDGRITASWAAALKVALDELYPAWLSVCGEVTTEPPKRCPNDVHRHWHPDYTPPAFVPDSGNWICVACGWTLDSEGNRIRLQFSDTEDKPRPAIKKGARRAD